ncbi:MAG TPA: hypothetical protein VGC76_05370 [Pyrinomonadaceae bacterium]
MTTSQKIARAFEIAGYVLLIPAGFGAFLGTFFIGGAPWLTLLIYATFIFGCVLLIGYFKHSRGRLDENRIRSLWLATGFFNAFLSLPYFFYALNFFSMLNAEQPFRGEMMRALGVIVCIIFAYLTAVVLAWKAYKSETAQTLP